ncbi:MAG TPA: cyclic pyranopterin monophosphate synthase MoaC [Gemmatimonadaceae bacterium]
MSQDPRGRDLTHVGADGAARMVDVSAKPETARMARATGTIRMERATLDAIRANSIAKGDVIAVARVAGVLAAKKTAELIPLCHPLPLTDVQIDLVADDALPGLRATATTRTFGRTGVEIEAISAVCVTLVTVYDMAKAIDKTMLISDVCLLDKTGGRSGDWHRPKMARPLPSD